MFGTIRNIFASFGTIAGLIQLIPTITALIHQVEEPGVSGAAKKVAVLTLLKDTLGFAGSVLKLALPIDTILSFSGVIIDTIVGIENALGRMTHAAIPAATVVPAADVNIPPMDAVAPADGSTSF